MSRRFAVSPLLVVELLIAGAFAGFATPTAAQVSAGGVLQRYVFDDPSAASVETLTLLALPFSARAVLGPRLSLGLQGTWAEGRLADPSGVESTITGLTDTQLTLTLAGRRGATSVTAIALLPTGNETQDLSESRVAGAVASELFPFAISNWGTGGGAGLSAATAHLLGGVGVGLSVSYLVRRSFEPLAEQTFAYRPGNMLQVVAAFDGALGAASKGTLQLTYNRHENDAGDDANLFRAGDRIQVMGSLGFPVGTRSTGLVFAALNHREQGTYLSDDGTLASQDLLLLGGGLRGQVGGAILQPRIEARFFRREDGKEQGYDLGGGLDAEIPAGSMTFVPSVRVHFGNLEVREGVETAFTGLEAGLSVRLGGAR